MQYKFLFLKSFSLLINNISFFKIEAFIQNNKNFDIVEY